MYVFHELVHHHVRLSENRIPENLMVHHHLPRPFGGIYPMFRHKGHEGGACDIGPQTTAVKAKQLAAT